MNLRPLLVRCYPARWRARYGDEFEAILEERPLGPFDVADILLGAFDAQLRLRNVGGADIAPGRSFSMSLRIGGFAAIIGAPLWTGGWVIANGTFGTVDLRTAAVLLVAGSLALLVALTGLSAFQARLQPVLTWVAFALPAVGTIAMMVGAFGVAQGDEDADAFFFGLLTFYIGSLLFAIVTYLARVLSRSGALVLGVGTVLAFVAGSGNDMLVLAALICFTLGWFALGVQAIRLDRPAAAARPA